MNFRKIAVLLAFTALGSILPARQLLEDLDFSRGKWMMVAISLHNYALLPIQDSLPAFQCNDTTILKNIQKEWVFEEKYSDYCDYHYALKFYKNGELVQTLRVNLLCNYISLGGFSYEFSMEPFLKYRDYFRPVKWSRIRFRDLDLLKASVYKLDNLPNVYWYGDVKQYKFSGNFMISMDSLPWNANRDSLVQAVSHRISRQCRCDDFYVQTWCWYMTPDFEKMSIRFSVFCDEPFFEKYKEDDVMAHWRSHFSEQNFVQIVVIGLNQEDYYKRMRGE